LTIPPFSPISPRSLAPPSLRLAMTLLSGASS